MIIVASTTLVFTVCGIAFAFGVYQDAYETLSHDANFALLRLKPGDDRSDRHARHLADDYRRPLRNGMDEEVPASVCHLGWRCVILCSVTPGFLQPPDVAGSADAGVAVGAGDVFNVYASRDSRADVVYGSKGASYGHCAL